MPKHILSRACKGRIQYIINIFINIFKIKILFSRIHFFFSKFSLNNICHVAKISFLPKLKIFLLKKLFQFIFLIFIFDKIKKFKDLNDIM